MNTYIGFVCPGTSLMPEIVADPPSPACYDLLPDADSRHFKGLVLISFASRATRAGAGSEHAQRAGPVFKLSQPEGESRC